MDPLTILSIAASTVQFLDFGSRLLTVALDSRHGGPSAARVEVNELFEESQGLAARGKAIEEKAQLLTGLNRPLSITEAALLKESRRCVAASQEISAALGKHVQDQTTQSVLDAIGDAFKLVWNEKSIKDSQKRLSDAREKLMFAMVSDLWERSAAGEVPATGVATETTKHQALIRQLQSRDQAEVEPSAEAQSLFIYHQKNSRVNLNQTTSVSVDPDAHDPLYLDGLLSTLHFAALDRRLQAIPEAYRNTFQWVLQKEPRQSEGADPQPLWSSFPDWLRGDSENIYWITGKPGSGKSTLIKHLVNQPATLSHLAEWGGGKKVLTAMFYSWDAGSELQKSQVGLLRTLLYQVVQQAPEIAPRLFPGRWAMQKIFGAASLQHLPPWTWEELFESVGALATLPERNFNLAIFVDGLDEFAGDHSRLIDLIRQFHSQPGFKLRMEVLTETDLKTFVQGVAHENVAFMELKDAYPTEADELLSKVVERACGVFLWVSLVMKAVLNSLTDGTTLIHLEHLVDSLPEDLSKLYENLWRRVKPSYQRAGSRLLLLFRAYTNSPQLNLKTNKIALPSGMEPYILWLADRHNPPEDNPRRILQVLRRKLASRTMGLLELTHHAHHVNYLHRTTKEWLDTFWTDMEAHAGHDFDPHLGLLRAISRSATTDPAAQRNRLEGAQPGSWESYANTWGWMLEAFYHAGRVVRDPHDRLVEALDRIEGVFKGLRFVTTTMVPHVAHWAKVRRGSAADQFGFVGLAAEFGVFRYVQAKMKEAPSDYASIKGGEEDLVSCLLLGPGARGLPKREYKALGDTGLRHRFECIYKFVFEHMAFNHEERYRVAKELLDACCDRKGKLPAVLRMRLAPLADRIAVRNDRGWPQRESAQVLVKVTGSDEAAYYGYAAMELLEDYGVGERRGGVRESFKAWLQWKLDDLGGP
ncbi:uncharacterized protein C8A04DRAFT_38443 [Dichotomopilus funicola]|uniref:NACHT domain-containing protein n=1 Tax=Dichotomopilus funicola TaxID=1934379 RepID=A0AAN6UZP4_9PEZI|nr:hypothetical protein C8A04DRAFT_38443 [Dichotomopilus funicola]